MADVRRDGGATRRTCRAGFTPATTRGDASMLMADGQRRWKHKFLIGNIWPGLCAQSPTFVGRLAGATAIKSAMLRGIVLWFVCLAIDASVNLVLASRRSILALQEAWTGSAIDGR